MPSATNAPVEHVLDAGPGTVAEISDLARREAERTPGSYRLEDATSIVVTRIRNDETIRVDDLERHLDNPRRARGTASLHNPTDFAEYVNRLSLPNHTTVWADLAGSRMTAVLNDHGTTASGEDPGWRDHTAALRLKDDPDWVAWLALDGKRIGQEAFAEFIEDVAHTVVTPDAATMLEIAQTFSAKRNLKYDSNVRLTSGERTFKYEETIAAKAGHTGEVEVPDQITVRIAPWMGVEPIEITARLRYRIIEGDLRIGYQLLRADLRKQDAFLALAGTVRAALERDVPVLLGATPDPVRVDR